MRVQITLPGYELSKSCKFYSSEDDWKQGKSMNYDKSLKIWKKQFFFSFGIYQFKFKIDDSFWVTSPDFKVIKTENGIENNII